MSTHESAEERVTGKAEERTWRPTPAKAAKAAACQRLTPLSPGPTCSLTGLLHSREVPGNVTDLNPRSQVEDEFYLVKSKTDTNVK